MHIEPGVVDGAKIVLSYATATAAFGLAAKMAYDTIRKDGGAAALVLRSLATTALVFDVGVYVLVIGVGVAILDALSARATRRPATAPEPAREGRP